MIRILGIDPGSRFTGFGVIESDGRKARYITSGCVRVTGDCWAERLGVIFNSISELVETYQPEEMAIERVFMHRNADSALKLGQARGAAVCAVITRDVPVHEYSPTEIKKSVVGKGHANKEQMQHMVRVLLKLSGTPQEDAADALGVALCHGNMRSTLLQIEKAESALANSPQKQNTQALLSQIRKGRRR